MAYFLYTLSHFFIQLSLQAKVYDINLQAEQRVLRSLPAGTNRAFPIVEDRTRLRLCSRIPEGLDPRRDSAACPVVFDVLAPPSKEGLEYVGGPIRSTTVGLPTQTTVTTTFPTSTIPSSSLIPSATTAPLPTTPAPQLEDGVEDDLDDTESVVSDDDDGVSSVDSLDEQDLLARAEFLASEDSLNNPSEVCLLARQLPAAMLHSTKKEDIVFIAFQFWTLTMSLAALANESIPYIIASFITHGMNTAWSAFQVVHTNGFRADYERIVDNGACRSVPSLLSSYWPLRRSFELPSLVLHILALLLSAFLTWKLVKLFGWNTFSRLGASRTKDRAFKLSLSLSSTVHLGFFFLVVAACLWIDELRTAGSIVSGSASFPIGAAAIPLLLIVPWIFLGSYAIAQRNQKFLVGFTMVTFGYLLTTSLFFISPVYRWTFQSWRFFKILGVVSGGLLLLAFGLSIACLVYWRKEERMGAGMGSGGSMAIRGDQESQRTNGSSDVPASWTSFTSISSLSFASSASSSHDEKPHNPFSNPGALDDGQREGDFPAPPRSNLKMLSVDFSSGSPRPSVDYGALHIRYRLSDVSPSSTVFPRRTLVVPAPVDDTGSPHLSAKRKEGL